MLPFWFMILYSLSTLYPVHSTDYESHDYLKREHTLIKPYQGAGLNINNWDYRGSVLVTSKYIRLTGDVQSQQGALWNMIPVGMKWWEVQINFKVTGSKKDLFGDGFAFWYVKEPMVGGPVFGSKDFFSGLAVVADTYSNHNGEHKHGHPYVSAIVNNGSLHYDHDMDGTHTQLGGCQCKFRNLDTETSLSISYIRDTLNVKTRIDGTREWSQCLTVSGVRLPTGYHFGVSAATGDLSDAHDIISITSYDLLALDDDNSVVEDRSLIVPSAASFEPPREHVPDPEPESSVGWTIVKLLVGTILIILVVVGGAWWYNSHQENKRKRFY